MKRGISAIVAVVAAAGVAPAVAADLYEPVPQAEAAFNPSTFDWRGIYGGVHVGYAFGEFNVSHSDGSEDVDGDGFNGGLYAGVNFATGSPWVYGAEADLTFGPDARFDVDGLSGKVDMPVIVTGRGRVGYAFDTLLVYGTAGLATGYGTAEVDDDEDSRLHLGYAIGAGVDVALTRSVLVRGEIQYVDLFERTYRADGERLTADFDATTIRVGAAYKF